MTLRLNQTSRMWAANPKQRAERLSYFPHCQFINFMKINLDSFSCKAIFRKLLTLCEVVPGREANGLQLAICHKLDVQVSPAGADVCRAFLPAVAANEG